MAPSPNNSKKTTIVDLSSSSDEDPDYLPGDPSNPYDYRHYLPGGMYEHQNRRSNSTSSEESKTPDHEHQNKRKHSTSSEGSDAPNHKKPTTAGPAAVPETTPKREAERPATMTPRIPSLPPTPTFTNSPLPPSRAVPEDPARLNAPPVQPTGRIPPNAARPNPQPVQPRQQNAANPEHFTQPLAYLYASSPSYRNLLFEIKSEKSRHVTKLKHMNELHAMEEQLSQARHTADMRRLQELIIKENAYQRDVARIETGMERERHAQVMGHLGRQIAEKQRDLEEKAGVR